MKKMVLLILSFTFCLIAAAQKISLDQFKNLKPRNIGPSGMSGRIVAIDAVHKNPSIIYVGAASGGIFKTEDGGINWKPIFDDQDVSAIGALAIAPSNQIGGTSEFLPCHCCVSSGDQHSTGFGHKRCQFDNRKVVGHFEAELYAEGHSWDPTISVYMPRSSVSMRRGRNSRQINHVGLNRLLCGGVSCFGYRGFASNPRFSSR